MSLLLLWGVLALGCAVWNGRKAREDVKVAVALGLLLGPAGVWLFPRRASLQWRPVIIVASGCSALMLLGLILALLQTP